MLSFVYMGLIPGVLGYFAYKYEVCNDTLWPDCDLWFNPAEKHALTICRASSSSVASAGEIRSPSGRRLAMNAIIQFLFCYQTRTEQRL